MGGKKRFGELPRRYRFALNPYSGVRWSRCPRCRGTTFQRKFPLLVHVDGYGVLVLGKNCRYCARCEFIICHQDDLEDQLVQAFEQLNPDVIGNDYVVVGTVERASWKKGMAEMVTLDETLKHTADIKQYLVLQDPRMRWGPII